MPKNVEPESTPNLPDRSPICTPKPNQRYNATTLQRYNATTRGRSLWKPVGSAGEGARMKGAEGFAGLAAAVGPP